MNGRRTACREWSESAAAALVLIAAATVAIVSARSYAGGWNDGSRLATVESLVDHRTLAIDRSIFVQVPSRGESTAPPPYPPDEPDLLAEGTRDKLLINGRFYSDKSPVPALLLAGWYRALQWGTGLRASERPDRFCYWMTLGSSGLAYVIAVWSIFQLGLPLRLPLSCRLALTASFGLATVALTYTRHVNNHILLLGVATLLLLGLTWLGHDSRAGRVPWLRLLGLGTLAGLGYTIDLGAGPVLLACTMGVVAYRTRRFRPVAAFVLAALPWVAVHHAVNYAIGGTFKPANAVVEYLQWPGSPFTPQNMTGIWNHRSIRPIPDLRNRSAGGQARVPRPQSSPVSGGAGNRGPRAPAGARVAGDPLCRLLVRRHMVSVRASFHQLLRRVCLDPLVCAATGRWLLCPGRSVARAPQYRRDFLVLSGGVRSWPASCGGRAPG